MEKIIITLIKGWLTYCVFIELFNLINSCSHKYFEIKKLENKTENNENEFMTIEDYENICKEITLLKSLHWKNKRGIKNIIKRLPFKGEEWEQEFIREELEEIEKSGYYETLEPSVLCDSNGPVEPIL